MNKNYVIRSWRKDYNPKPVFGKVLPFEPATKIFDQLTFIGNATVCCYLYETEEGLVLIDAMNPEQPYLDAIVKGIQDIGYEIADLKAVLITHGHGDHYGMVSELKKMSGARVYMSKVDYELARTVKMGPFSILDCEMDGYLEDGQEFAMGNSTIQCVATPGHTQGCMSFIIPVTDEGRLHHIALWGGTGLLPGVNIYQYLMSVDKFSKVCDEYNVEGCISNHPSCDNGIERVRYCREICNGMPNPYVITHEQYQRYENKYRIMCYRMLEKADNGIVLPRNENTPSK